MIFLVPRGLVVFFCPQRLGDFLVPRGWVIFLATQSSSRSLVVGRSVSPSVGHVCEIVTFRVLNGN